MITYIAASYYPRFGDAISTAVAACRCPNVCCCSCRMMVENACELAAECETEELQDVTPEGESYPEIISGMAFTYRAKELFTAAELREHRRELMRGNVVWL